jgi:glycogen debranching enzyme
MSTEALAPNTSVHIDAAEEIPFYIPATGAPSRPRLVLKHGDTFAVLDNHGDVGVAAGGLDGLFFCDTRFLSRLELRLNGLSPLLLGCSVSDDNSILNVDLTNPDIFVDGKLAIGKDTLHLVRTTFLWHGTAYQRLGIFNHGDRPIATQLSIFLGSDFADIFEVRGLERARRGITRIDQYGPSQVVMKYKGLDGRTRRTGVIFEPPPARLTQGTCIYPIRLDPGQRASIFVNIKCDRSEKTKPLPFFRAMLSARHELKAAARRATTIETSNDIFNEMLCRSIGDLYMLVTDTPEGPYPYAGIPWYSTTFGRDGLITALEMLWIDPSIARGVLRRLAAYQARTDDALSDAQPGKILHEMRLGEMAALREVPFGLYYGSVDSTPLFILLAGLYAERTGDDAMLGELWPNIEAALGWIDDAGDSDRDGFTEYHRTCQDGLVNQGWKDSHDAVFHHDGKLAQGPIALAEVQGYVYAAKLLAARGARRLGRESRALELESQARDLAARFETAFWCPDIDTYAIALDGEKQPCRTRTSNAGQLLFTGIVRVDRAAQVVAGLLSPRFFSGWGIRTVASGESRYNPMSYHNGSIWPHDNALIALGFARYGYGAAIEPVYKALFDAVTYMDLRRLPELFCGFQRRRGRGPTLYPVACSPQAWASGAPLLLLQASLGIEFIPTRSEICFHNPTLPSFLETVMLRNLQLGDASVDVVARRHDTNVSVDIIRTRGSVRVSVVHSATG